MFGARPSLASLGSPESMSGHSGDVPEHSPTFRSCTLSQSPSLPINIEMPTNNSPTRSDDCSFRHGDRIRLTCETEGIAEGSGGDVVGWYTNEPDRVLVRLWSGGLHHVPVNALERAAAA